MVNPIYLIAAGLGGAFTLGLLRDQWRAAGYTITLGVLAFTSWIAASWVIALASGSASTVEIITAGTQPPFAVNLRLGLAEAVLVLLMNLTGLLSALYLKDTLFKQGRRAMAVLLIFSMALSGIVMTRDLFNLFVFFEILLIASYALLLHGAGSGRVRAGLHYVLLNLFGSALFINEALVARDIHGLSSVSASIAFSLNAAGGTKVQDVNRQLPPALMAAIRS